MTRIALLPTVLIAVLVCLLPAAPVQAAGAARTFVSATGSDSNNCTNVATPCRHLAAAYAATAANGEIYVLDPANYGALTITGPVSIEGHGWASIAPVVNGNAITINANPGDKINIIGVVLDGTFLGSTTGIAFTSGGSLIVRDSVIRNFADSGIFFQPSTTSQISVSNTLLSDNGQDGIAILANGATTVMTGVLDNVVSENNTITGMAIVSEGGATVNVTISDSVSANNATGIGTNVLSGTVNVMVRDSTIANNSGTGVLSQTSSSTIRMTRSTITGNGTGWNIGSSGVVLSYGDNNIDGNTNANTEPPNPLTYK
jgi:hypothetical protein